MSAAQCPYCAKGDVLAPIGIEISQLSASTLYLFKEQSHPGRCILAYAEHVGNVADMPDAMRNEFFADMALAARAIQKVYNPDKINFGAYGDTSGHVHFHLVPKYRDGFEWGGIFAMNPQKTTLTDAEYEEAVNRIRQAL